MWQRSEASDFASDPMMTSDPMMMSNIIITASKLLATSAQCQ